MKKTEGEIRCVQKVKDWERRGNSPFRVPVMRWSTLGEQGGDEGGQGGKNPVQAEPPKRVREASHLILKNSVNRAREWLSLITEQAASCIRSPAVSHHRAPPPPTPPIQI